MAIFVALALVGAACGGDDASSNATTTTATAPTTTQATTTATPGAATGPLELVGTYDGENCSYAGPETATLGDEISLMLVNDSANAVGLKVILIPPDRLTDLEPLVGSDFDYSNETFIRPTFYAESGPFAESSARSFLPAPGTYVVECALGGATATIHVWWLAALKVNP